MVYSMTVIAEAVVVYMKRMQEYNAAIAHLEAALGRNTSPLLKSHLAITDRPRPCDRLTTTSTKPEAILPSRTPVFVLSVSLTIIACLAGASCRSKDHRCLGTVACERAHRRAGCFALQTVGLRHVRDGRVDAMHKVEPV